MLNASGSSAALSGTILTMNVSLTFKPAFAGNKTVFIFAYTVTSDTGFPTGGTWNVPSSAPPTAGPLTPSSGSGTSQTFTAQYTNPGGASAFRNAFLLFNSVFDSHNACYVSYTPGNGLYLLSDNASTWMGPITPGTSATLQNTQCILNASGSSASLSGTILTMNVSLTFKPAFAGNKTVFIFAYTVTSDTGFPTGGTWNVPSSAPPTAGPLTPSSGSGASQTFSAQYTNPGGASTFTSAFLLINSGFAAQNSCYVSYLPASNGLYLLSDTSAWTGPITPGSSGVLQNNECVLNASGSGAAVSGTTLTLNVSLTFKPAFAGGKTVFIFAYTPSADTGFQVGGTWTAN
jgi:hypothetical protein